MKPLIDTQEFLALSSFLNYQLAGEPINWHGILNLMVGRQLAEEESSYLLEALAFLGEAYGVQKRRLGPLAVLHPIRVAALLSRAQVEPDIFALLTTLCHDQQEDITADRYDEAAWQHLNGRFDLLLRHIDTTTRWPLVERVGYLTKTPGQKYYHYLGRLLRQAVVTPELAAIKLADRLDNTLDLRVDLHDFTDNSRCFQIIFDALFVQSYHGIKTDTPHPIGRKINGAMRLYQLYKNAVFLSLLRQYRVPLDSVAEKLFFSLAIASIREAQTILLHIFAYHVRDPAQQRELLQDVMRYSSSGGFNRISRRGAHSLDGLFTHYFEFDSREKKKEGLAQLYENKTLMGRAAVGFIIISANFINDSDYVIDGISASGIIPQDS